MKDNSKFRLNLIIQEIVCSDTADNLTSYMTSQENLPKELIQMIEEEVAMYEQMLLFGNATVEVEDLYTSQKYTVDTKSAINNLKQAIELITKPKPRRVEENSGSHSQLDYNKEVFTFQEVCAYLSISKNTLTKYLQDGLITHSTLSGGNKIWIKKTSIEEFLNKYEWKAD